MSIHPIQKRLYTTDEYHRMVQSGILKPEDRVELLRGEVKHMSPIGSKHAGKVNRISSFLVQLLGEKAITSTQNPIQLGPYSEPEPDISLLNYREDFYESSHPQAEDIILLIEVADSTIDSDREVKLPLFAAHGIPEVWIVNLQNDTVEVYLDPQGDFYAQRQLIDKDHEITISQLAISFAAASIIG